MTSVDASQTDTATATPVDLSQVPAPVTAAATAADTATPPQESATQQGAAPQEAVTTGTTGAGVDESGTNTPDAPESTRQASGPPSMQDYERRKAALLNKAPEAPAPAPAPEPAQAPAPKPAATPAAPTAADDDDGEFPTAPTPGEKPKAIKIRPADEQDVRVMAEYKASQKAGNKQTFVEFVQARYPAPAAAPASQQAAAPPTATNSNPESNPATTVQTVAQVDARLKELKDQRYKELQDFNFEAARQIEEQEETLRAQREQLQRHESARASEAEQRQAAEQQRYLEQAANLYPQATQPGDPLVVQADAVYKEWQRTNDPRAQHPSGVLLCYMEAAEILKVPVATAAGHAAPVQTPSLKTPTPPPVPKVPLSALVASGNAAHTQTRAPEDTRSYEEKKADFLRKTAGRAA